MNFKTITCIVVGHKISHDYNDSGFETCKRCGIHEYYDFDNWRMRYCAPYLFYNLRDDLRKWLRYKVRPLFYTRCYCKGCRKFKTILWFKLKGDHHNCDCLPF